MRRAFDLDASGSVAPGPHEPSHAQGRTSVNRESGRLAAMRARALAFLLYPVAGVGLASIFVWPL